MSSVGLYLMNQKGYETLSALLGAETRGAIAYVVGATDAAVQQDYAAEILALTQANELPYFDRKELPKALPAAAWRIAIGWRWLLPEPESLIVFHDSLLPRYRGFAPLVNALINGETAVGVTALLANKAFDRGDIIAQKRMEVGYPIKIQTAIEHISALYASLALQIVSQVQEGKRLEARPQDERRASYSLWRDQDDYRLDWSQSAASIKRKIDAVGFPYAGAHSWAGTQQVRILEVEDWTDVRIEIRQPGKVLFLEDNMPVIVCGEGLLWIKQMQDMEGKPWTLPKFRTRFS